MSIIPDFSCEATINDSFKLSTQTKPLILFFYPRDNTSGCTSQNQIFAELYPQFIELGYEVVGISRDTLKSHIKFSQKYNLPFNLLADPTEEICNLFNVMRAKKMYGKDVRGIERSTFIIDTNHQIIHEWRKVKAETNPYEVLEFIKNLANKE